MICVFDLVPKSTAANFIVIGLSIGLKCYAVNIINLKTLPSK